MQATADKPRVFYTMERDIRHGYEFTTITVREGREQLLADLIEQCVDNKAGYYGNPPEVTGEAVAKRMHERYTWMLANGYAGTFDYCSGYDRYSNVEVEYQHYSGDDQFCQASIILPRKLEAVQASTKLLARVVSAAKRAGSRNDYATTHDPKLLLAGLKRMRAIRLVRVVAKGDHEYQSELCTLAPVVAVQAAS